MELKISERLCIALDRISKTGGDAETSVELAKIIGPCPVLIAVAKGEATMGDVTTIRQLAERRLGSKKLDTRLDLIAELLHDMRAMAEATGANLTLSGPYMAAKGLLDGTLSDAEAVLVSQRLQEPSWRRASDLTKGLLHLSSVWSSCVATSVSEGQSSKVQPALIEQEV